MERGDGEIRVAGAGPDLGRRAAARAQSRGPEYSFSPEVLVQVEAVNNRQLLAFSSKARHLEFLFTEVFIAICNRTGFYERVFLTARHFNSDGLPARNHD